MKEVYDNEEQKIAARQMYQALAAAWDDRKIVEDELAMLQTFAFDVLGIGATQYHTLSKQYIRSQILAYPKGDELYYKAKYHGDDKGKADMSIVTNLEDRVLDKDILTREFARMLQLGDMYYEKKNARKPSVDERKTDDYGKMLLDLITDFGNFYYLVQKSPGKDLNRISYLVKKGFDPESAGYEPLSSKGHAFSRVEAAYFNKLEEQSLSTGADGLECFLRHRFSKTYSPKEFIMTRLQVRNSGQQLGNVILKAITGEQDLFRDTIDITPQSVNHMKMVSQYIQMANEQKKDPSVSKMALDAAELHFERAFLEAIVSKKKHERIAPERKVQFEDLKHLVNVLEVMLEDSNITKEEAELFVKIAHETLGLPRDTTELLLNAENTKKLVHHPAFK